MNINVKIGAVVLGLVVLLGTPVDSLPIAEANEQVTKAVGGSAVQAFNDVKGHWAEAAIVRSVKDGYVKGYADGTFRPNAQVTRAEFLAIITRASKLPLNGNQASFSDVPSSYWASDAIQLGSQKGFINSTEYHGSFKPNQAITRGELAKWLSSGLAKANPDYAKALQDTKNTILPFTEFYGSGFAKEMIPYVAVARGTGVVGGFPDGSFGGSKTTTRAEVVATLYRYLGAEAKDPKSFRDLNEIREVGLTGTNIETLGNPNYGPNPKFNAVMNKAINFHNNVATGIIKRLILVDASKGATNRGVYTPMFTKPGFDGYDGNAFNTYIELEVLPKQDISNGITFKEGIDGITCSALFEYSVSKYNLPTISTTGFTGFFKKDIPKTVWTEGYLSKGRGGYIIRAIDGTVTILNVNEE